MHSDIICMGFSDITAYVFPNIQISMGRYPPPKKKKKKKRKEKKGRYMDMFVSVYVCVPWIKTWNDFF